MKQFLERLVSEERVDLFLKAGPCCTLKGKIVMKMDGI